MASFRQLYVPDLSATKQKAVEDARVMQTSVEEDCHTIGQDPPAYHLDELIGKGSFGRVYRAHSTQTNQQVAIKIINIEENDNLDPHHADTYTEFMKEINALKLLRDSGAQNINHVIEALPIGQSMWMITEHCAGGSVATLMRPSAPGGLQEKWIIPILREVSVAISWVHKQGIIHRDIKCANVLIHEAGGVQLCDFGVAGMIETNVDKRTTFIGTLHWMAPEILRSAHEGIQQPYGKEVDIWAFGAMAYELARGQPPNVAAGMDIMRVVNYIQNHAPRLDGNYSEGLKSIVSYCLVENPYERPTIELVQQHSYILNTSNQFPTVSLTKLVQAYRLWEAQGGIRRSLFGPGGAQMVADEPYSSHSNFDEMSTDWNFSTTAAFDQQVMQHEDASSAVYDVYGPQIEFDTDLEKTSRPMKPKTRRRQPPPQLPSVKAPLEKLFDPNTMSNYNDNARMYYARLPPPPPPPSVPSSISLPLPPSSYNSDYPGRSEMPGPANSQGRESLIDLDASLDGGDLSSFTESDTIRASRYGVSQSQGINHGAGGHYSMEETDDLDSKRRTQDWTFPVMAAPVTPRPEDGQFRFPAPATHTPNMSLDSLPPHPFPPHINHGTTGSEPDYIVANRVSTTSLIDLDEGLAPSPPDYPRPSTAYSDVSSISSSDRGGNHFEFEKHASMTLQLSQSLHDREPSIYVSDDSEFTSRLAQLDHDKGYQRHRPDLSQGSIDYSEVGYPTLRFDPMKRNASQGSHSSQSRHLRMGSTPSTTGGESPYSTVASTPYQPSSDDPRPMLVHPQEVNLPSRSGISTLALDPPDAPLPQILQGLDPNNGVKNELLRLIMSFGQHLDLAHSHLSKLPVQRPPRRSISVRSINSNN